MEAVWKYFIIFVFLWAFFNTFGVVGVRDSLTGDVLTVSDSVTDLDNRVTVVEGNQQDTDVSLSEVSERIKLLEDEFNTTIIKQMKELETLEGEFQDLEGQLDRYFDWFKSNSRLDSQLADELRTIEDCVGGTIRLPCIWFRDKDLFGIEYLHDSDIGKADLIQNISFTVERGGGDCEDLAMLFMAESNHLQNLYDRRFEAWNYSKDGNYQVIGSWWMKDAAAVEIPGKEVYVVCYSSIGVGHCINAFCEDDIIPRIKRGEPTDVLLNQCSLVEPENYGEFWWTSGNSIGGFETRTPFLGWMIIISSEDLCADINGTWKCFTNFRERVETSLSVLSESYKS